MTTTPYREKWVSDCGTVTLYCGDCLEVLPTLEAGSVDAVVTDPPYSSGGMVRGDRMASTRKKYQSSQVLDEKPLFTGDNRDQRGFLAWCSVWLMHLEQVTVPGGVCCLFTDWRQLPTTTDALQSGGFVWRGIVPWDKCNSRPMPNRFTSQCEYVVWGTNGPRDFDTEGATYHDGIIRCQPPPNCDRVHSTQKPVEAMTPLVEIAKPSEVVLDPFMGSGTTGVACIQAGRKFIGIEKTPHYFEESKRRIIDELNRVKFLEPPTRERQKQLIETE